MKFSHQLQFNAVPDWAEYYVPYSNLKKLVYSIERDRVASHHALRTTEEATEQSALLVEEEQEQHTDMDNDRFISALDRALDRIVNFYSKKETELYDAMDTLMADMQNHVSIPIAGSAPVTNSHNRGNTEYGASVTATTTTNGHQHRRSRSSSDFPRRESLVMEDGLPPNIISQNTADTDPEAALMMDYGSDKTELKRHTVDVFVLLSELKSFVSLNATAFAKILKKYDKITGSELKRYYTSNYVSKAYPFRVTTKQKLNARIQRTERAYASMTEGDLDAAVDELKSHLRERIVWERNTVWRDMIGQERKVQSVGVGGDSHHVRFFRFLGHDIERQTVWQWVNLLVSLLVFALLVFQIELFPSIEQNRCFAILVFASMLWATEVMPLFATAMLIPFLTVTLRVMRSPDLVRLSAPEATRLVFSAMFSPVIMLLLGGFAIAASLSKFGIAKAMATFVLSKAGTRPSRVLLVNMFVATVASMWISNVAAPVLCFSLIQPILRTLPVDSTFGSCLILGIALASNVGGMTSPISSPQNIIAIQNMNPPPSWGQWFIVAVPLSIVGNFIIWIWLLYNYHPEKHTPQIHTIRASHDPITPTQVFVMFVTLVTIALWCLAHSFENILGDMGVIAIIPLVAFFGTGLLTKDDFNHFLWSVIMLAMGGIVLGKAVESSGLLHTIATHIQAMVKGFSPLEVLLVFNLLVLCIATFISHTVAALIILPIVAEVGSEMADPRPRLLVMGTAFVCSVAMGLPVSGFPNMNAVSQENELGKPYLKTKDFLRNGVPASVFCMICVAIIGYGLMTMVGF
ncbi:SPX domain-containing protein [Phascolomyces articulosus]|uniref:SPX domain-containing protein n=1 Tax=Phascolomyces articulosus TaxID=60185 RepID=A0AAD5K574_9FUNG|nr:SPX domain-containing protein [Phascolomyces articulosus]